MLKNKKNNFFINNKKGFTTAELVIAIVIMIIFVTVISTIFINIYISFMESKRYSAAMMYATQLAEKVDKLSYEEVTEENLLNIEHENGYDIQLTIETNTENTLKKIYIKINYYVGSNLKNVELEKTKTRNYYIIPNAPNVKEGMVPVRFVEDGQDGYWVIASSNSRNWYNYYTNNWANIMLLDGLTIRKWSKSNRRK